MPKTQKCQFCSEEHELFYRRDWDPSCKKISNTLAYLHNKKGTETKLGYIKYIPGLNIGIITTRKARRHEKIADGPLADVSQ